MESFTHFMSALSGSDAHPLGVGTTVLSSSSYCWNEGVEWICNGY